MAIDTIRVRTEPPTAGESPPAPGVVDVSDLPAARIRALVGEAGDGVYLERRGGRTFLVDAP